MNDELVFADERDSSPEPGTSSGAWKIMIVDDHEDVHRVTRMVFEDFVFEGRKALCLSAYSGREALELLTEHSDTAVMLLDVVMETNTAGLDVAQRIRAEFRNRLVRIILRTGQPGEAPEQKVVTELDINDYRQKTELTADRLATAVTTAIRSYRDLKIISDSRKGLHLLAMSVAHQVRNRTVAIAGFANLLKRREDSCPGVSEHLLPILDESGRLEVMVRDVTGYASIELGQVAASNIRELLEEAMNRVEDSIAPSGQTVQWDVFCPDQMVQVDPRLFVIAFEAILQNSVDYSGDNPRVRVTVAPDRLACAISVTDYGRGIEEKDLPFVFDPFFSLKPKGSGMGLCVTRKVALEHQWDLDMTTKPGVGTTVRVTIPRREMSGLS